MKLFLKKVLRYFIRILNITEILAEESNRANVLNCRKTCLANNVTFHKNALIHNGQNNPNQIVIGELSQIAGTLLVFKYGGKITIGKNCYIGDLTRIWAGEEITIGNNVLISHNVNIMDTNAHEIDTKERIKRYQDLIKNGLWTTKGTILNAPISIGDNVWISFNVTILKGVTIGEGAIIGAGSIVTKDIPPYSLSMGNPCKVIKLLKDVE
jgi:acetyltransferase-like isoleucine patch superfamily enzyme